VLTNGKQDAVSPQCIGLTGLTPCAFSRQDAKTNNNKKNPEKYVISYKWKLTGGVETEM